MTRSFEARVPSQTIVLVRAEWRRDLQDLVARGDSTQHAYLLSFARLSFAYFANKNQKPRPERILNDQAWMSKDSLPLVTPAFRLRGFANTN